MFELAYLAFFVLVSFGLGSLLLGRAGFRFHSFIEELVFSVAAGYGAIILVTCLLGFLGLLYNSVFLLLFLAVFFVAFRRIMYCLSQLLSLARSGLKPRLSVSSALLFVILFFALFNLVASLAPPWSYDTTVYHLAVPKIYAEEHSFVPLPSIIHAQLVMAPHMAFLAAIVMKNGVLANLVNFTFSIFLAIGIYAFCCRFFSKKIGVLAAAVFYTLPIVSVMSASAHADAPLAFFAFSAFYAFAVWAETGSRLRWLLLSAFLAGLAASSKLTGISFILIMSVLIFCYNFLIRKSAIKNTLADLAVFLVASVAVAFPAYLKNWVYAGNPFFPLFYQFLGGNYLNAQVAGAFSAAVKAYGTGIGISSFLLLPWNMTMYPLKFVEMLGIGPLFLAFVPLIIFLRKSRIIKLTLAAGILCIAAWFFTSQALRYALYAFPFFSIAAAFVIFSVPSLIKRRFTCIVALVVVAVLFFNAALLFGANAKQLPVALKLESADSFFARLHDGNIYSMCEYANSNLPEGAKILLLYENRGYHCDRDYVVGVPTDQAFIDYSKISTPDAYAKRLQEIGITHVIVNRNSPIYKPGGQAFSNETAEMLDSFLQAYGALIHSTSNADLYAVKS